MSALAHAKWFTDARAESPDWGFLLDPATLLVLGAAVVAATAAVIVLGRLPARGSALPARLDRFERLARRAMAIGLGIALVALALRRELLSPAMSLDGASGTGVAVAEGVLGVWLLTGVARRAAAAATAGLVLTAGLIGGPLTFLEAAYVLGIVAYLLGASTRALGLGLGGSLVVVAFSEKLADPGVTLAVLHAHPVLNVAHAVGLPVDDSAFVRLAGAVEVSLGLLLMSGVASRLVAVGALVPFAATVMVFGVPELVGHLPIYGALAAVAIASPSSRPRLPGPALRVLEGAVSTGPIRPRRAVVSTIPSDAGSGNLVVVERLLSEAGFAVANLGPCAPIDRIVETCLAQAPDLIVVSTVNGHGHVAGPELIRALRRHDALAATPAIIVGKLGTLGPDNARYVEPMLRAGYDAVFADADGVETLRAYLSELSVQELAA